VFSRIRAPSRIRRADLGHVGRSIGASIGASIDGGEALTRADASEAMMFAAIQSVGPPPERHADRVVAEMMRRIVLEET
jgi:hypothetical protein